MNARWILIPLLLTAGVTDSRAEERALNAFGIYAAPTTHHVESDTAWETMESSTMLDFAAYYSRDVGRGLVVRGEARYSSREFTALFQSDLFPSAFILQPTQEAFLEFPIIFHATELVPLGEASLRISVGGGVYYAVLVSQEFPVGSSSLPDAPEVLDAGGYSRYGWIGDGGVALLYEAGNAVFMNFRIQDDLGITGESEGSIAREDEAFGFYAGFEWLF